MVTRQLTLISDLKNTTDDALPNYLSSLKFQQSHFLTDVRLALGYSAVALTAAIFLLDRQYGWDKTKDLTLWAVIVYFVLNAVLNAWTMFVEKGQMFVGTKDGKTVRPRHHAVEPRLTDSDLYYDQV